MILTHQLEFRLLVARNYFEETKKKRKKRLQHAEESVVLVHSPRKVGLITSFLLISLHVFLLIYTNFYFHTLSSCSIHVYSMVLMFVLLYIFSILFLFLSFLSLFFKCLLVSMGIIRKGLAAYRKKSF
jgi:hypothetical protein